MESSWILFTIGFFLQFPDRGYSYRPSKARLLKGDKEMKEKDESRQFSAEKNAGDPADILSNLHHHYPPEFKDLGRRFVPVYPYSDPKDKLAKNDKLKDLVKSQRENQEIIPVKASPERVLEAAMQSALEQALHPVKSRDDVMEKDILRTGDYWNSVWVEDVDPVALRSKAETSLVKKEFRDERNGPKLGSVKVKIMPGSKLYGLVSVLKQYSPRLLYVINKTK